jgi:hypothetical protein
VIQHLQLHPEKLGVDPTPIAPEVLQNIIFSDGRALPPSLQLWLSFDARSLGLLAGNRLRSTSLSEAGGPAFDTLQRLLLPDQIYRLLPDGGDSMYFLYGGGPDDDGEYPVFVLDIDDQYFVELCAPNFAVWLGSRHHVGGFALARGGPNPIGFSALVANPDLARTQRAAGARFNRRSGSLFVFLPV